MEDKAFVISDIHGCLIELKELIKGIDRTKIRVILVGDLIDRGKDSRGVINFVRDNNIECVKGNHELMFIENKEMIQKLADGEELTNRFRYQLMETDWFFNGGKDVFESYKGDYEAMLADLEFLKALPVYIKTSIKDEDGIELLVSHTWLSHKNLDVAESFTAPFVWDREQPKGLKNVTPFYNIYGHTPVDYINQRKYHAKGTPEVPAEPEWFDGCAAIDTGCAYNVRGRGILTGVYFPSLEIKQAKLKEKVNE